VIIATLAELRSLYPEPNQRVLAKELPALDRHCRHLIELSPFVVIASGSGAQTMDASPRGGAPGFVRIVSERRLLIPDAAGNNRLDTLQNIVETGKVGLLFLIPGVEETLRVNGSATLSCAPELIARFADEKRPPRLVIDVSVSAAYLHCPKALMRAHLWQAEAKVDRARLPTIVEMINQQTGIAVAVKSQDETRTAFAADL